MPPIQDMVFGDSALSKYKYIVIICITLAVPINIVSPIYSVREDRLSAVFFPSFVAVSRILTIVAVAIVCQDINVIMWGMVIYQVVITAIALLYSKHKIRFIIDWDLMRKQLCYSIPFGMAVSLQLLSNYFDKIVSITLLSPSDYAVYSVAFLSIPGVNQLYDSLAQVNIINMSKCYQAKEYEKIVPLYKSFVQKTLSFSTPIIIAAALYAEEIIGFLFTEEYSDAATYFRIYSLTFLIAMFGAGTILRSVGKTNMSMYAFVISCAIGLPLTYYLIKNHGVDGAIFAAVVNIVLPRFIQMWFEVKVMHQPFSAYLPWAKIIAIVGISILYILPLCIIKVVYTQVLIVDIVLSIIYIVSVYATLISKDLFLFKKSIVMQKMDCVFKKNKKWKSKRP